jgi:Fur family transcriptional regulator, ferric uptake regulator
MWKLEKIERACRERGLRMTGPRHVVARVIADMDDHPDVRELHRRAAAIDGRISLATVYRTMKRFEDLGIIERHAFRDGPARYESKPAMHHDHLIDLTTGRVIEFRSEEIERLQAEIARKPSFRFRPRLCGKSWGGLLRPTGARGDIVLPLSRHAPGRYAR